MNLLSDIQSNLLAHSNKIVVQIFCLHSYLNPYSKNKGEKRKTEYFSSRFSPS